MYIQTKQKQKQITPSFNLQRPDIHGEKYQHRGKAALTILPLFEVHNSLNQKDYISLCQTVPKKAWVSLDWAISRDFKEVKLFWKQLNNYNNMNVITVPNWALTLCQEMFRFKWVNVSFILMTRLIIR